jgi:hypothetical protein
MSERLQGEWVDMGIGTSRGTAPDSKVITGAIKWGDANFAFAQLRRQRTHTPWPPP